MHKAYSLLLCEWLREGVALGELVEYDEKKVAARLIAGVDDLWLQFLDFGETYNFLKTLKCT